MRAAVARTTGVSSTTVASRLRTAVTTADTSTTRVSSPGGDRPARRAVTAAAQENRPSRSARWASSRTTTRNATVGAISRTAASASVAPTAPTSTRKAAPGSATATGGRRRFPTAAADRVAMRMTADTVSATRSTTAGSGPEEQVNRDRDAEGHDQHAQGCRRDAGGDPGTEESADEAGRGGDRDHGPLHVAEEAEDDQRDGRGDRREGRLQCVGQLQPVQGQAEDADQDHAERAAEVAAVDRGEEQRDVEPDGVTPGAVDLVSLQPPGQQRMGGEQQAGQQHEDGDHDVEGRRRRRQQQDAAHRPAEG